MCKTLFHSFALFNFHSLSLSLSLSSSLSLSLSLSLSTSLSLSLSLSHYLFLSLSLLSSILPHFLSIFSPALTHVYTVAFSLSFIIITVISKLNSTLIQSRSITLEVDVNVLTFSTNACSTDSLIDTNSLDRSALALNASQP